MTSSSTQPPASRFRPSWFVWLGVVLLAVSLIGAKSLPSTDTPTPSLAKSSTSEVRAGGFGHVDAEHGVTNVHAKQPGEIVELLVNDGDEVEKDAPLFRMDDKYAQARLLQAKAAVSDAEQQLRAAHDKIDQHAEMLNAQKSSIAAKEKEIAASKLMVPRVKELLKAGFAKDADVEAAETKISGLEKALEAEKHRELALKAENPLIGVNRVLADLQAKEQAMKLARFALDECTVRAPYKGRVLRVLVNVGTLLGPPNPQMPAIQFAPLPPYIVRAEIEQEFAARVAVGQTAQIQDDTRSSPTWTGRVKRVGPWYTHRRSMLMEPGQFNDVRTLEVIIEMDNPPEDLKMWQKVRVTLQ